MKLSVFYHSVSGNTLHMAQIIAEGMNTVPGAEARVFSIDEVDEAFAQESKCFVLGCPIYSAGITSAAKAFLEKQFAPLQPAGKLGGAFATAQYVHGGGELGIQSILNCMMARGMLVYSAGGAKGRPNIHLGPVAIAPANGKEQLAPYEDTFRIYGQRMAEKAMELFG